MAKAYDLRRYAACYEATADADACVLASPSASSLHVLGVPFLGNATAAIVQGTAADVAIHCARQPTVKRLPLLRPATLRPLGSPSERGYDGLCYPARREPV